MIRTVSPRGAARRRARTVPVVVMNFCGAVLEDTDAVGRVAAAIVAEHERGANVVALLPPYGRAADELSELVSAVSPTPHPRELDLLVSAGSSMSAALCAMAVHRRGCRAVSLDGPQAGIVTDAAHTQAEVVEIRTDRIAAELRRHGIVLVPGLHGIARSTGDVTALGPGGPDAVAAELAAALGARASLVVRAA